MRGLDPLNIEQHASTGKQMTESCRSKLHIQNLAQAATSIPIWLFPWLCAGFLGQSLLTRCAVLSFLEPVVDTSRHIPTGAQVPTMRFWSALARGLLVLWWCIETSQ